MGWTSTHRRKGQTHRDYFQRAFGANHVIVADGMVNRVWYAAVEHLPTGEVYGLVALIHWNHKDEYNFTYKDMSENMGPGAAEAPAKVLNALTPTDNEYALEWRRQCSLNLAKRALRQEVAPGDKIVLNVPLTFTNGVETDTFTVLGRRDRAGRVRLYPGLDGQRYRIPQWRDRIKEVVRAS